MNITLQEKLNAYSMTGDGTGFWDSYEKTVIWDLHTITISIAARNLTEEYITFIDNILENASGYDLYFKKFITENREAIAEIRKECGQEDLTADIAAAHLEVSTITLGYECNEDFCIWFIMKGFKIEHGIQVYGNLNGTLTRIGFE